MILVKLIGGLGNQMFQYAAARRLAEHHRTTLELDTSWYDPVPRGHTPRAFELDQLSITGTRSLRRVPQFREALRPPQPGALLHLCRPRFRAGRERHFHFDPDVLDLPDGAWLSGYWLSEKYFADIAPIIRAEFAVRSEPSAESRATLELMARCTSVAVHLRRGDYVRERSPQGLLGLDYYMRAAEFILQQHPDAVFFVFSDDPDWVRVNFTLDAEVCVVDHNRSAPSAEDLRLMSACRHNIIANSSYSWWSAWLNPHPDRIVVAPQRWMADPLFDTRDVLPAEWVAM